MSGYFESDVAVAGAVVSAPGLELSVGLLVFAELPLDSGGSGLRESVTYHPDPLNTTPTGYSSRFTGAAHSGHSEIGASFIA